MKRRALHGARGLKPKGRAKGVIPLIVESMGIRRGHVVTLSTSEDYPMKRKSDGVMSSLYQRLEAIQRNGASGYAISDLS